MIFFSSIRHAFCSCKSVLFGALLSLIIVTPLFASPKIHVVTTESPATLLHPINNYILVEQVLLRMGFQVKFTHLPWSRALQMVRTGMADAIASTIYTENRSKFLTFSSEPLDYKTVSFFVKRGTTLPRSRSLSRYSSYSIGAIRGYSYGTEIDTAIRYGILPHVEYTASFDNALRQLVAERTDVLIGFSKDVWAAAHQVVLTQDIEEIEESFRTYPTYLAFSKRSEFTDLASSFSKTLREMKKDGSYKMIKSQTDALSTLK